MFKCGLCGKDSEPRESPIMVVLKTRARVYTLEDGTQTNGSEIVKEVTAHRECAVKRND